MTTASTFIDDALQFLGVSSYLVEADPDQQQRCFTTIQRLFYSLPTQSVYLNMRRPSTTATNLREPGWSTEYLVAVIAKNVVPYFPGISLSPEKVDAYSKAMAALKRKTARPIVTQYPSLLPIGAGNSMIRKDWHFYPGDTQYQYTQWDDRNRGEQQIYYVDFEEAATERNTSVSSVVWLNIGAENATISGETLSSNLANATLLFPIAGNVSVRARATFASGEIFDGIVRVGVTDPESISRSADFG